MNNAHSLMYQSFFLNVCIFALLLIDLLEVYLLLHLQLPQPLLYARLHQLMYNDYCIWYLASERWGLESGSGKSAVQYAVLTSKIV